MATNPVHEPPGQAARHDPVYDDLAARPEFAELRKRYRGFVIPATIAFLVWYLLYVVMSNWASGFMNTEVVGNINVALIFGLLQFVTTFGLAWYYSKFSTSRLDPLARDLEQAYRDSAGNDGRRGQ
ncbi:DUF485 domain-containing protein [Nocardioides seonyuensis]|uniref:DUF485 domain-containing protein n=1 Tax=Nocardioides seonyuensis TaxID=2518371 RepID=A0A4P7IDJ0_9ACTN|nr:DUF485 domain-containing protein [Nocardioides seonyuensis]QBX55138.1 DUF485 domain-containing protein [Nocardioides seonyuensis]